MFEDIMKYPSEIHISETIKDEGKITETNTAVYDATFRISCGHGGDCFDITPIVRLTAYGSNTTVTICIEKQQLDGIIKELIELRNDEDF